MEAAPTPIRVLKDLDGLSQDVSRATSLSSSFYTSQEIYETELRNIFYSKWLVVCHISQLKRKGDVWVQKIGNKSIIIVKDERAKFSAFYNVCRHRGSRLVNESCNLNLVQCPYHGWTYTLDGQLVGSPEMELTEGFRKEDFPLYSVRLEIWGGFIFVNLDDNAESLASYLGDFVSRFQKYGFETFDWAGNIGKYEALSNWKVYMENFSECYHCGIVHPETIGKYYRQHIPYDSKNIFGPYSMYYFDDRSTKDALNDHKPSTYSEPDSGEAGNFNADDMHTIYLPTLFPNAAMVISPSYVATYHAWPDGLLRTNVSLEMFASPSTNFERVNKVMQDLDYINKQDITLVSSVQEGLNSEIFRNGRFSTMEGSVHAFERLYIKSLTQKTVSFN
jgi:phenylpropionate dioxygenase-like ring-hydroxylating dioxygenase large terminal subunit